MRKLVLGLLAAALLVAVPVSAQEQRGSIQGAVKDSSGGVLPGVTVEAKSPSLVGVQTAVTDTNGAYRFPALAPGKYTISASLQGFGAAKIDNVDLIVGSTLKIDLTMSVAGVSVTETVKGEPPLIDVKANAATATVSSDIMDLIPKGRNFTSALTQIPGTNNEGRGGGIMVDGASGSENRYIVDGLDTTNARTGTSAKDVITDFISSVTVKQSGYNAEYRAATGGVISAVTKSGSNVFHGDAGSYYTSNDFLGAIRPSIRATLADANKGEYVTFPRDKNTYSVDPVFDIGGPVLKDKIWFFAGYNPSYSRQKRTITWANPGTFEKTQTFDTGKPHDYTANYNATAQIAKSLRGRFTGSNERVQGSLGLPAIQPDGTSTSTASTFNPRSTVRTDSFTDSYTGTLDWVATSKLYMALTAGYFGYGSKSAGGTYYNGTRRTFGTSNIGLLDVPASLQQLSGYADNQSNTFAVKDNYSRLQVNADATYFGRWKGDHAIKFGGLFERIGNDVNSGQQATNIAFSWDTSRATLVGTSVRGKYGFYTVQQQTTVGNIHSDSIGLFAQDAWTISNKLTVNYGVRLEHEVVPSYRAENPGLTFGWDSKIAPRLGFAYDIKGDSRWKTYGSWGVFYDTFKLEMPRGAWGAEKWIAYYYTLDTPNWSAIDCTGVPGATPACPGTFIEQVDFRHVSNGTGADNLVDQNMKPVKTQELTLGMDHELSRVMSIGVRYAHKWINTTIEDIGVAVPGVGEVFYIANPGLGLGEYPLGTAYPRTPDPVRKYDGVELVLRKRLSNNWQATTSFLVSRLWGTYSGLANSDENGRTSPNVSRMYDGLYMNFDQNGNIIYGRLQTDRPFQFKFQGSYNFKWGTSVGVNFNASSGVLQTTQVTYQGVPVDVFGRGDLGRSPMLSQTDLLLSHDVRLPKGMRASFQVNINNLFDQDTWTTIGTAAYRDALVLPATTGSTPQSLFFAPNGFNTVAVQSARFAANSSTGRRSPLYKLPSGYQGSRSIRLFAKISF
ncbi:MAG: TonB-dependent receptor [Acidobacteria bacterium]|nr:TonB-dependent receptor [Acidobacteriota bacterium]MBP8274335.1 TonB-dependent receptor [Acidobacteriota bacterium]MBP8299800.1 TonB-dependent receptor [Planctomycetota bacterium]